MLGFSSMSSFTNETPVLAAASSSSAGSIALHGPHHGAQKSTTTGCSASSTSLSKVASVTLRIGLTLPVQAQQGHRPHRFEHDRLAHLRVTRGAVGERDGDLEHPKARLLRAVGHLDLEGIAALADRGEVDLLEHGTPEALEAPGR